MKDETKIKRAVEKIDRTALMKHRQQKLQDLVNEFGIEKVALASGLRVSTIRQNIYAKSPQIGYDPLTQAETILIQLFG